MVLVLISDCLDLGFANFRYFGFGLLLIWVYGSCGVVLCVL